MLRSLTPHLNEFSAQFSLANAQDSKEIAGFTHSNNNLKASRGANAPSFLSIAVQVFTAIQMVRSNGFRPNRWQTTLYIEKHYPKELSELRKLFGHLHCNNCQYLFQNPPLTLNSGDLVIP